MKMTGNTILVTGGNSGIGLRLAEEFLKLGNTVIVSGRSREKLKAAEEKGLNTIQADLTRTDEVHTLAREARERWPSLNGVIHSAGIMKNENLLRGGNQEIMQETIAINLLGTMLLTEALLPNILKEESGFIMTVSSGLAYSPLAMTPTYSATKAAIHSYTQSLRFQLRDTRVQVMELVPPYVQTFLMGERQAHDPMAMPLEDFISEVMDILKTNPDVKEILVERVMPQRNSADGGRDKHETFFWEMNKRFWEARKNEFPA